MEGEHADRTPLQQIHSLRLSYHNHACANGVLESRKLEEGTPRVKRDLWSLMGLLEHLCYFWYEGAEELSSGPKHRPSLARAGEGGRGMGGTCTRPIFARRQWQRAGRGTGRRDGRGRGRGSPKQRRATAAAAAKISLVRSPWALRRRCGVPPPASEARCWDLPWDGRFKLKGSLIENAASDHINSGDTFRVAGLIRHTTLVRSAPFSSSPLARFLYLSLCPDGCSE